MWELLSSVLADEPTGRAVVSTWIREGYSKAFLNLNTKHLAYHWRLRQDRQWGRLLGEESSNYKQG